MNIFNQPSMYSVFDLLGLAPYSKLSKRLTGPIQP